MTLGAVFATSVLVSSAWAAEDKATLPDLNDSAYIYGQKMKKSDLKGKVIFFEYWGINCPPCIASIPHLQELHKKFQSKGFVVLGSHSQGLSPKVKEFLESKKVTFPVYQGLSIPEARCPGGIPYAVLIGANGKIVAKGNPTQLYDKVKAEVMKSEKGFPILEGVELKQYKSLEKALVSNGKNLESKITPLRQKTDDEEAQAVCDAFDAWVQDSKEQIQSLIDSNPLRAIQAIVQLKAAVPSVKDFDESLAELKSNSDLSRLADIQKKVSDLEAKKGKGKKVAERDVEALEKSLAKYLESDKASSKAAAEKIQSELESLGGAE